MRQCKSTKLLKKAILLQLLLEADHSRTNCPLLNKHCVQQGSATYGTRGTLGAPSNF